MSDYKNVEFSYLEQFYLNDGLPLYEAMRVDEKIKQNKILISHIESFTKRFLENAEQSDFLQQFYYQQHGQPAYGFDAQTYLKATNF
jgi:hypothetical protein